MGETGFNRLLEIAWEDYEQGNFDNLYYDLTGENDYADLESQLGYYNKQINDLSGKLSTIQKYDDYMAQYQDVVRGNYIEENDRGFESLVNPARKNARESYNDPNTNDVHRIYSFINGGKEFYAYYQDTPEDQRQVTRAYSKAAFMLPDEIEVFDSYYNAGEYGKALSFLNGLSFALNQRASYYEEIETREDARKYPILSSIASLTSELMSGGVGIARTFAGAAGDKSVEDPYSAWYATTRQSTQAQEEIADMIGGEGGKVYLAGMNALRNMMNAAAISSMGITGPWAGAAGLSMFATQIYQDSTYKYLKEYNDYDKAVSYALLDAALETMEEKLPYDVMLSGGSNIFLNWLASSISEGLEELTGATVGEEIKAQLTNGGRREWEERRDKIYNEGGYTDENGEWVDIDTKDSRKALAEAQTQALREYWQGVISNTLSGMAGGGIGGIYGAANNYVQNTRIGRTINNQANNVDSMNGGTQLINVARGMFNESQSRQLAEQLYKKTQSGKKVSNYEIGKLARNIVLETSQEGGKITRETVERLIQQQMRDGGANEDTIEQAAPIIASAVIDGNKLSKSDFNVLAGSKQAIDTYKTFMSNEGQLAAGITAVSNPDVQKMQSIRETVGKLMEGGKGKSLHASVMKDVISAAEGANVANQDDMDRAVNGTQKNEGTDAIVNDEIVQVVGMDKDGVVVEHEDGTTETVSADEVLATNKKLGTLIKYGIQNKVIDSKGFQAILKGIAKNEKTGDGQYIGEAIKTYIAGRVLGPQPVTILDKETANEIYKAAEEDNAQANKDRMADRQQKVIPGKGTSEFNGAQYGTKEWNQQLNDAGLTKQQKNQAGAVAEYAKRLGFHVTFVNNPDMEAEYGWEDRASGKIYINLAGRHADFTVGGKTYSGANHHLLVTASHEFTHWLEQNSPKEYAELRQFVFNKLRRAGQDIESLAMHKMDLYRQMAQTDKNIQELDLEGAMAEIVANACDQVLGSEKVAAEIEKESPKLYEKVKQFVTNLVERIRQAAAGMENSMSKESRALQTWADELQNHWLRTLKEAQSREQGQAEAQEGAEGVQHSWREDELYDNWANENEHHFDARPVANLAAAADVRSPARTSKTTDRSSTSTDEIISPYDQYVKNKKEREIKEEEQKLNAEYMKAVEEKDDKKARQILREKLNNTKGIYPFLVAHDNYQKASKIAKQIKEDNVKASILHAAATDMARLVPDNAVLIPMPGHTGKVAENSAIMRLTKDIAMIKKVPVINAIEGVERESRYAAKKARDNGEKGVKLVKAEDMGFHQVKDIPEGKIPIVVDNVISVGETAKAAIDAINGATVLAYAKGAAESVVRGLKSADITYEKGTNKAIPLDKRYNIEDRNWRHSIREMNTEYMQAVSSGNMEEAQKLADKAAEAAGYVKAAYHGTLSGGFTIFDKAKAGIGGNSGAGFYFTSNKSDSEENYHNVEGADNWFKARDLAEKLMEMLSESDEDEIEYEGYKVTEDMDYEDVTELAKQILTKNPQIYSVYLNPGRAYIRDYKNSTNLLEDAEENFDESLFNRDDYDDEDQYYEAVSEARDDEKYQAISDAVYNGIADVESHYEFYTNVDYEKIIGKLWEKAIEWDALIWDDLVKVLADEYIEIGTPEMTNSTDGSHEIARAIVENFGFDSIEDREVSSKFNQLKNMGKAGDTIHYIMFRPEQIKLADAVTRDNEGNVIPLSERFNPEHPDMRYSVREMDNQYMQAVKAGDRGTAQWMVDAQAIKSGFTTEDAFHGTASFGFDRFDMEASGGAIFVAYSPKIAGTYVDNGDVRMIGKKYPIIGLDIMSAEQLAEELQEYYRNLPKTYGYETASEWTVKGIDKDDYVDFVLDYAENMKKLAAGKVFEKELSRLVDKLVALAHTGDEKAAYQAGVDLQRRFRMADFFGQDDIDNRRIELSAMMIPALAKGEDVININRHGMNYYLSRSDVIRQLEKYNEDREGIYKFYTRPGNQLLIDAKGANWNKIWIEDEYLRNDIWGYFNPTEAYEAATGQREYSTDMFTVTTRELSEYARYRKYDSVRINDVFDHGGRGDWDRERGHGDIAMFFNPNDVKSADPVTYDENGDVVPLSERFSDNDDLRYSFRDEGDMEINRWMRGLTAGSLKTEQERVMLRQWQEAMGGLDVARHALNEHQQKLRKLEALDKPSAFDRSEIIKEKNRIEIWRGKVDRYEKQMVKATSEKGFARMMYKQSRIMDDLVNGRTEDEVHATVDAINAALESVKKEMADRSERLKELAQKEAVIRVRQQLNSAGLKRIAAKLKGDLNSELSNTEIENRLALMALKMKEGRVDEEDVTELADMLIGKMRRVYDSYILDSLRGTTITLSQSQLKELKAQNSSLREVRRELAGTGIRIDTKGGNTLDKNWAELCKIIPALQEDAADKDMLDQLLRVITAEKEAARQQYAQDTDMQVASMVIDAASELVPEIVTDKKSMQLIRETLGFIADMSREAGESAQAMDELNGLMDRLQKKGKEAKSTLGRLEGNIRDAIAYNNALAEQSEAATWKNERHKLINQLNDEHTKEMLKQQAEFREKMENDKTARNMMNENMALRRRINTNVNRLRKLLIHESTKDNVPEHMKGIAREMLTQIVNNDLTGRKITGISREDLVEISRVLTAFEKQDGKYNPDELKNMDEAIQDVLYNALEELKSGIEYYNGATKGKKLLENLENFKGALTEISNAVSAITGIINAERSIVQGDRRVLVQDQAYKVQESAGEKKKKELTGKVGLTLNEIHKFVISGNLTPEYFFRMLKNAGLDELWEEYHREENKNGLELAKAQKKLDEIAKKYGFSSWNTDARQEVNLQSGKVNMTLGQIMSLYATWKREHTLGPAMSQHLTHGGFYVEEVDPKKGILGSQVRDLRAHRVTEADMEQVEKLLTKEQIDFVNDVVSYMSNEMSELGNDASMKAYGIKLYKESYYFPFKMWDGVKAKASNDSGSAAKVDQVFRPSFSKTRLHGANNAVILGDFMQTATDHIVGMINYATMGLANENMQKVLNAQVPEGDRLDNMTKRNIRTVLQEAYGREAMQYLAKLQEQLNGGAVRADRTLYDKALTLFRKNAVAGSMSVTLQQPLSYIRAAMLINPKYLAAALSPTYWKGSYAEMMAHSGVAVIKKMGRFDMGFGASAREYIMPEGMETKARKVWDEITDKATILPELADQMTWTRMWSAVKMEQHDLHPKMDMNSDEFLDMVGTRFNEVMRRTQVYDSVLTKSQNMRSQNPFMKSITSFMAEPTLSLNVLMDAVRNAKEKGGKAMLAKAVATFLLSAVAQAAVKAVMSSGRSPDDKKTWKENFWYRFWQNAINETDPLNLVPGYNDIVTVLKEGKLEDDALGAIGKIFSAGEKLLNITGNPADYRSWEDSAGQLVQLFTRLPAKNIMRDLRAAYNWFIGKPYANRDTSKAVLGEQFRASFMTADNMVGVIVGKLGEAGYKTSNEGYYGRMYSAMKAGNKQAAEDIKEFLQLTKSQDDKKVATGLRGAARKDESLTTAQQDEWMLKNDLLDSTATLTTQYKEGKITAAEYKKLAKDADPKLTDNDVWWKIDRIDYQKEKGGDSVDGYYYRLTDAVNANKGEDIQKAVKDLLAHGITKEKIKSKLSDWKQAYLSADNAGKIKIRDALQKAYRAAGYTAKDADKTIEGWKKDAEKKK